jgi:GcrA cell cycle regulator
MSGEAKTGPYWTEARITVLTRLWAEGCSASEVAQRLGGDATRSSVLGKLYRLGLLNQASSAKTDGSASLSIRAAHPRMPREDGRTNFSPFGPPPLPPRPFRRNPVVVDSPAPLAFLDMPERGRCRWPLEGEVFAFCGNRCGDGVPYCAGHHEVAYDRKRTQDANRRATKRERGRDWQVGSSTLSRSTSVFVR